MKGVHWLLAGVLIAALGCQGVEADKLGPDIWQEAKDLPVGRILWIWIRDVVIGTALGGALGLCGFLLLKWWHCYRVAGRARVWVLIAIGLFMTIGGGVVGAGIGNLQAGAEIAHIG